MKAYRKQSQLSGRTAARACTSVAAKSRKPCQNWSRTQLLHKSHGCTRLAGVYNSVNLPLLGWNFGKEMHPLRLFLFLCLMRVFYVSILLPSA